MNASRTAGKLARTFVTAALFSLVATTTGKAESTRLGTSRNLVLWDTVSPVGDKLNGRDQFGWKAVPDDLLQLEKDPPKASSDPGYYGRDYSFRGDAVVQTPTLTAVFCAARGCVSLYSTQDGSRKDEPSDSAEWPGSRVANLSPILAKGQPATISQVEVLQNSDDEIVLKTSFSSGSSRTCAIFSFDSSGTIEVRPTENMNEVRLSSSLQYGVVPDFVGDDLIYSPEQFGTNAISVPSDNVFLGLLRGEGTELVMTWPKGKQRMNLRFGEEDNSIDFNTDAQNFYLAILSAPGIWHKEALTPDYLEKDTKIQWKRPFSAKWKTQLYEEELKTTFTFRESKGDIWRGVAGSYVYPVWFDGDQAYFYLSKKVAPQGQSLIYCLERRDTPLTVLTPVDILKETLGRQAAEAILDTAGRKLRTHHRRADLGVRRACTCGCTEAIQAVFEAGDEVSQKDYIQGALEDMIYFVHCHVERINEYRQFADGLLKRIQQERQASAELKPFLDSIEEIVKQIPQEYEVQKENMKNFAYADELSVRTIALTARKDPNNVKAYMELLKDWRAMGGAQDYVLAKCHVLTRSISQAAGYDCAALPGAVSFAREIRARCRQTLRNPDGYEIWADY